MKINSFSQLVPIIAVIVTSLIGFMVAYRAAPNIAWGRLFIDLGVILAIFFLHFAMRKNNSDQASDSRSPLVKHSENPNISFSTKNINTENHSHHPELGSVRTLNLMRKNLDNFSSLNKHETMDGNVGIPTKISDLHQLKPDLSITPSTSSVPVDNALFMKNLFSEYTQARKDQKLSEISYEVFQKTVEDTRKVLLAQHDCRSVRFDIVAEKGEVALRPRLIR